MEPMRILLDAEAESLCRDPNVETALQQLRRNKVCFSTTIPDALHASVSQAFGLHDLPKTLPMTWISGDTPAHKDRGSEEFDFTYLVYLTSSNGSLVIGGEAFPIVAGSAFAFPEGTLHETIGTGDSPPRLLLGPMTAKGQPVGGIPPIGYFNTRRAALDTYFVIGGQYAGYEVGKTDFGYIGSQRLWKIASINYEENTTDDTVYENGDILPDSGVYALYAYFPPKDVYTSTLATRNKKSTQNTFSKPTVKQAKAAVGEYESCEGFTTIIVTVQTTSNKKTGFLNVHFSEDKKTATHACRLKFSDTHIGKTLACAVNGASYFRVVFQAANIVDMRSTQIPNDFENLSISTTLSNNSVPEDYDIDIGNQAVPFQGIDTQTGPWNNFPQQKIIGEAVAQGTLDTYPLPDANCFVVVANFNGLENDINGTGAQTFRIDGIDEDYNEVIWHGDFVSSGLNTNGILQGFSVMSPFKFIRVNSWEVTSFGSARVMSPDSVAFIYMTQDGFDNAFVGSFNGPVNFKHDACVYTVPRGYTCRLERLNVTSTLQGEGVSTCFSILKQGQHFGSPFLRNNNNAGTEFVFGKDDLSVHASPGDTYVGQLISDDVPYTVTVDGILRLGPGEPVPFESVGLVDEEESPVPWTPALINTQLWLDANDAATIVISSFVSNWADKSGNANDAVQLSGSNYPRIISNGLNGLPTIRFDGTSGYFNFNGDVFTNSNFFCLFVAQRTMSYTPYIFGGSDTFDRNLHVSWGDGFFGMRYYGNDLNINSSSIPNWNGTPAPTFISMDQTSSGRNVRFFGDLVGSDSNTNYLLGYPNAAMGYFPFPGQHYASDLSEFIVLRYTPSDEQRQLLEGYVAWKWGLQSHLPSGHTYRNAAPTGGWTPAAITPTMWLDASDAATITAAGEGETVSSWNDKSGNTNNATQSNSSYAPVVQENAINSLPAIRFVGGPKFLLLDGSDFVNKDYYCAMVVQKLNTPVYIASYTTIPVSNEGLSLSWTETQFSVNYGTRSITTTAENTDIWVNTSTPVMFSFSHSLTFGQRLYINGDVRVNEPSSQTFLADNPDFALGATEPFTTNPFDGEIAEIIVTSAEPAGGRDLIEGYLAHKWGLQGSLDNDHPYKNAAPTSVHATTPVTPPVLGYKIFLDSHDINGDGTPVEDGAKIELWVNKAFASNAEQFTAENQPRFVAKGTNGQPCVRFSAADATFLSFGSTYTISKSRMTIFLVATPSETRNAYLLSSDQVYSSSPAIISNFEQPSPALFEWYGNADSERFTIADYGVVQNGLNIICVQRNYEDGALVGYVNGTLTLNTNDNVENTGRSLLCLGSSDGRDNYFTGDICALIVYDTILDAVERTRVEAFLRNRFQF